MVPLDAPLVIAGDFNDWRSKADRLLQEDLGVVDLVDIDWMIVGGESGYGARPMQKKWVEQLLKQCRQQGVRFFFKQWGGPNKKATGRLLNNRTYDELPILQ